MTFIARSLKEFPLYDVPSGQVLRLAGNVDLKMGQNDWVYTLKYGNVLQFEITFRQSNLSRVAEIRSGASTVLYDSTQNAAQTFGDRVTALCKWVVDHKYGEYRHCLTDQQWLKFVGAQDLDVDRYDWDRSPPTFLIEKHLHLPCYYCGCLLPWWTTQVDHRAPKSKPSVAISKVLRAAEADNGYRMNRSNRIATKSGAPKRVRADHPPQPGGSGQTVIWRQHTGNPAPYDLMLESICALIQLVDVPKHQMQPQDFAHHMFNLVPSCQPCNVSKGDRKA